MKLLCILIWLSISIVCCQEDDVYGDEMLKPKDRSHWVDPTDMINYDHATQTMKNQPQNKERGSADAGSHADAVQCQTDERLSELSAAFELCQLDIGRLQDTVKSFNGTVSTLRKTLEKCTAIQKELFFQQFIRSVLEKFKNFAAENYDIDDGAHYDVEVKFTAAQYKYLLVYATIDQGSLQEVHSILSNMFQFVRWSTIISSPTEETWSLCKEYLLVITQVVSIVGLMLWICKNVQLSPKWIIVNVTLASFIVSIPWNWWHLYKKEVARRHADILKGLPGSCQPSHQTFWTFISSHLRLGTDECTRHYESLEIDPLWEVPPSKAVAVTFTKFFLEPAGYIGEAINHLLAASFSDLPFYMFLPVSAFLIFLVIIILMVVGRYRIRTLLFSIEPHHVAENPALLLRIGELETENRQLMVEADNRQRAIEAGQGQLAITAAAAAATGPLQRRVTELEDENRRFMDEGRRQLLLLNDKEAELTAMRDRIDDLDKLCERNLTELRRTDSGRGEGDGSGISLLEFRIRDGGSDLEGVHSLEARQPIQVSEATATATAATELISTTSLAYLAVNTIPHPVAGENTELPPASDDSPADDNGFEVLEVLQN